MSMGLDARDREGYIYRSKPSREQNTFLTVLAGVFIALFAAGWTVLWVRNVDGVPVLCGLVGLVILVAGLKIAVDAPRGGQTRRAFDRDAVTADATVLDRYTERQEDASGASRETYQVVVRFIDRGQRLTLQAEVDESIYTACWRGRPLAVRYASTDPSIALLEGEW